MNKCVTLLLLALGFSTSGPSAADSIDVTSLGRLDLEYRTVVEIDTYPGQPLAAEVSFRQGEAFSVVTPYRVQRLSYLLPPGAEVTARQPIAVLEGPEIHHFLSEFDVKQQLLENAERRFINNRELYAKKAIESSQWLRISEDYYRLKLEFEHMRHFHALLLEDDGEDDVVTITAPVDGVIKYSQATPGILAGEELAVIIPPSAIRLQVALPSSQRGHLAGFDAGGCRLGFALVGAIARDFFVEAWSTPLQPECRLLPGERLMVVPRYSIDGYRVDRASVFQWQGRAHLFVLDGNRLEPVPVDVAGTVEGDYVVSSQLALTGREVLVTSVSAVQGVLLGLGGE